MGAANQELTERAKLLISERRYQEAVRACRRALLSQPDQVEIRLLLGEALLALERYDEVRVEMMALARKVPDRGAVHRLLGEAYLRDGRPAPATEALRKALALDPGDEVAQELLSEAADENAPISTTIERWFADEAEPTLETESPGWEEEHTGPIPVIKPATRADAPAEPSVQIDPALTTPAHRPQPSSSGRARPGPSQPGRPLTSPARPSPRVRSRKPTLTGQPSQFGFDLPPPEDAPLPPPPTGARPAPPSAPPRPSGPPPSAGPPRPRDPSPHEPEPTHAARPSALRPDDDDEEPLTGELSIEELDSDGLVELEDEPTRAHLPAARPPAPRSPFAAPPRFDAMPDAHVAPRATPFSEQIDTDREATSAYTSPLDEPPLALEGEPTRARVSEHDSDPPTLMRRPIGDHYAEEPPTFPPRPAPSFEPEAPSPTRPLAQNPTYEPSPPVPTQPHAPTPSFEPQPPTKPATESPPAPRPFEKNIHTERVAEKSRRWLVPTIVGVLGLLAVGALTAFGVTVWMEANTTEEIRAAAATAGDSGMRSDLEAVIDEIGDAEEPELRALKARVLATLALEHEADTGEEARSILSSLPVAERPTDAAIASALLAVDEGEPSDALQVLSGLTAEGEQIAEAFRARAFATAALGRWEQANDAATQAATLRSSSPRHVAMQAIMQHRTGDSAGALALLERLPEGVQDPAVRVARARILHESGGDPARAVEDATAVVETLSERASPHQLAWAHLIRAEHAAAQGDGATATEEARAAAEHPPPGDEAFAMGLVETFLRAGAAQEANTHLADLPDPPLDAPARAMLTAEVALAVGDLDRAEEALGQAEEGPRRSLLRAQILDARGRPDEALEHYERAMDAPGPEGRRARVRLAAAELRRGRSERVIELLEPAQPGAVDDLELVPLLARAYLMEDRADDAQRVLDVALSRRPEAAELLATRGALQLHRGQIPEALGSLRRAAEARPQDPDLQADLGDAARLGGDVEAARAAYDAALALREDHPRALVGLGRLALAAGELEEAERRLNAAAEAGRDELEVARLRGQLFVTRGDGASAVDTVRPLAERFDDAVLWTALGALQAQAESDRDAARSFEHAQELDRGHPQASLGQTLIDIRRGDLSGARRNVAAAEREAARRGIAEQLAPWIAVAKGRLEFEMGDFDSTVRLARQALEQSPQFSTAHLLLANVAIERGDDAMEHLRNAANGHTPPPEALGRLAPRLPRGSDEACETARRYMEVAPNGYDASEVRRVLARCR